MKPLNEDTSARDRIIRLRWKFGMIYGMAAGAAFAIASWGRDGYVLSISHAYYPWVMFLVGLLFCVAIGGLSGRLTARFESSLIGIMFWLIASAVFAWLMVTLPLRINPAIVTKMNPQLGALLNYDNSFDIALAFGTSLIWVIPFMLIVGVAQLPITESAVFSTSIFGKVLPLLFCIVVASICGSFTDSLINAHFRDAIVSLDGTIQFVLDNRNNDNIDKTLSREMHASALRTVSESVRESRRLFVRSYDESLGDLHILVKFDNQWVDCNVLYSQPVFCEAIGGE